MAGPGKAGTSLYGIKWARGLGAPERRAVVGVRVALQQKVKTATSDPVE